MSKVFKLGITSNNNQEIQEVSSIEAIKGARAPLPLAGCPSKRTNCSIGDGIKCFVTNLFD